MVQIIQERKKPSFGEKFSRAVGTGLDLTNQYMQGQEAQQKEQKAIEAANALVGFDTSGFDPDTRKALLVEGLKQQGKDQRTQQQQSYLDKIWPGNQQNEGQSFEQGLNSDQNDLGMEDQQSQMGQVNPAEIPDEFIARLSLTNKPAADALQKIKDVAIREQRENIKQSDEVKKQARKEELQFHKESQKYDEDLTEKTRRAKNQIETFKDIEKAIDSGNVKPSSWTNILRNFGDIGRSLSNAIMNSDQATILSSIPQLLEGWKQVFGVRLTDADLKVLQDKLPDIGKSPEANKAILKVMRKYGEMATLRYKIASDIKKQNKGLRPLGYADRVEERFDEMTRPVRVINPKTGNAIEIPAYKVGDAISAGASLADE